MGVLRKMVIDHFPGVLHIQDSAQDDFELWSPSEERTERCLFGRQVRRIDREDISLRIDSLL